MDLDLFATAPANPDRAEADSDAGSAEAAATPDGRADLLPGRHLYRRSHLLPSDLVYRANELDDGPPPDGRLLVLAKVSLFAP